MEQINKAIIDLLSSWQLQGELLALSRFAAVLILVMVAAWAANFLTRRFLLRLLKEFIERSPWSWDDVILRHRVLHHVAFLAPALVIYAAAPLFGQYS